MNYTITKLIYRQNTQNDVLKCKTDLLLHLCFDIEELPRIFDFTIRDLSHLVTDSNIILYHSSFVLHAGCTVFSVAKGPSFFCLLDFSHYIPSACNVFLSLFTLLMLLKLCILAQLSLLWISPLWVPTLN